MWASEEGAVAPKPVLSTHRYSKLLGFLAFSQDSSFSTRSYDILANHACSPYNPSQRSPCRIVIKHTRQRTRPA
jgi:predicted AlkP superfamily pyrophosphatase or phosphodiesterase